MTRPTESHFYLGSPLRRSSAEELPQDDSNDSQPSPREQLRCGEHHQAAANIENLMEFAGKWLRSRVRRIAAGYGLDQDDLMQELMLSLLRRRATVDGTHSGLYSWLNERIQWTARDMLRCTKRDRETPTSPENLSTALDVRVDRTPSTSYLGTFTPPSYDPTETLLSVTDLKAPGLSDNEAQTVMLIWYGYDLLLKEFAELVGRSPGTIRKEKERGLRKISNQFGLTDQETTVFTTWRTCGSASAAARSINMADSDVSRIVSNTHKKIRAVFDRRLSAMASTGSGPWLAVYGRGPESEDAALHVREQCIIRGIDNVLRPIDEIAPVRLDRFAGLVVVLPSQLDARSLGELLPFSRLILDYRARRPEGLDSILDGSCEWFDAGVVQVVGRHAVMQHPVMRTALYHVCARHYTDGYTPPDVFQPYTTRKERPVGDVHDDSIECLWHDVQAWGVSEMSIVPELLKCIENCRKHYENNRFKQLYRPIPGLSRNRLDIILDGPHDVVVGNQKAWMENGARVWRYVERQLRRIVPSFRRPADGDNKRGAQEQLRKFYLALRIVEIQMRTPEECDSPSSQTP